MPTTIRATFDGKVLRPEHPVDLKANTTYIITIEQLDEVEPDIGSDEPHPLTLLGRLAVDMGIDDFAVNHDYYAHGLIRDEPDDRERPR